MFVDDALSAALYSDALASSHPISVPVLDPSEIGEIFDTISYEKVRLSQSDWWIITIIIIALEVIITTLVAKSFEKHQDS